MTSLMWVLLIVGLILLLGCAIWGIRYPRRKDEPFGRTRWIVIALSVLGAILAVTNFIISLID